MGSRYRIAWALRAAPLALTTVGVLACTANPSPPIPSGATSVQGTWSGTASADAGSIRTDFTITDDGGALSGVHILYDPTTGAPIKAGKLTGQRNGNTANWTTMGGVTVVGTFDGNEFNGTATFPGELNLPTLQTALHLDLGGGDQ
jgi:hypothetical protein